MVTQHNSTNIKKSLAIFLEMEDIRYVIMEETEHRQMVHSRFSFDHGTLDYYITYDISHQMLNFFCMSGLKFNENSHAEIRKYYSYVSSFFLNSSLMIMHPESGESISKSTILLDDVEDISLNLIQRHFAQNYYNFQQYFSGAMRIAYGDISAKEALSEVIAK